MDKKDGGQAFPRPAFFAPGATGDGLYNDPQEGMTLRDWFAGPFAPHLITPAACRDITAQAKDAGINPGLMLARIAYEYADMMLKAREE